MSKYFFRVLLLLFFAGNLLRSQVDTNAILPNKTGMKRVLSKKLNYLKSKIKYPNSVPRKNTNIGFNSNVMEVRNIGSELYVVGYFTMVGNDSIFGITKWDGTKFIPLGDGLGGPGPIAGDYPVMDVTSLGSDIIACGAFILSGKTTLNSVAKWDGKSWNDISVTTNEFAGERLLNQNGYIYMQGFYYIPYVDYTLPVFAKWDGKNWSQVVDRSFGPWELTYEFLVDNDSIYILTNYPTQLLMEKWNGVKWDTIASCSGGGIWRLLSSGGKIFASGGFSSINGVSANRMAIWDGVNWSAWGSGTNGNVNRLITDGTNIYAGGSFTSIGGVSANCIAKWDGSNWSPLGEGMNGYVNSIALLDGKLYAGGVFSQADNKEVNNLAVWDGSSWNPMISKYPTIELNKNEILFDTIGQTHFDYKYLTIKDTADGNLYINKIEIIGANPNSFIVDSGITSTPHKIPAFTNSTIKIKFSPKIIGTQTATLLIYHDASVNWASSPISVNLTGTSLSTEAKILLNKQSIIFDSAGYQTDNQESQITITNQSTKDTLIVQKITYDGNPGVFTTLENMPIVILPGSSSPVTVRFIPSLVGSFNSSLHVLSFSDKPDEVVNITGRVVGSNIGVQPQNCNIGIIGVNDYERDTTITITNTGLYNLLIESISFQTTDQIYRLKTTIPSTGITILPGQRYSFTVTISPKQTGIQSNTIVINNNSENNKTISVNITTDIRKPSLTILTDTINFNTTTILAPKIQRAIVIRNDGLTPITITSKKLLGDSSYNTIKNVQNITLQPGSADTITIEFYPNTTGKKDGTIDIVTNDLLKLRKIILTGTGGGNPVLTTAVNTLDFGSVSIGDIKDTSIIIRNTGNIQLNITSKTLLQNTNNIFSFINKKNSLTLKMGESDTVNIRLGATQPMNNITSQFEITSDDPSTPRMIINLTGTIRSPILVKSLSAIIWSPREAGTKNDTTFTITNTGNLALIITNISFDGTNASDFSILQQNFPITLNPAEVQTFTVSFRPLAAGTRFARILIDGNDPTKPTDVIAIRGTGVGSLNIPIISLSQNIIDFDSTEYGKYRDTILTIKNSGISDLTIDSITISNPDIFKMTISNLPITLTSSDSINIPIRYQPTDQIQISWTDITTLRITSNAQNGPVTTLNISGKGYTKPALNTNKTILTFNTEQGINPPTQIINITNTGTGILNWNISNSSNWLDVNPKTGTDNGTITITILNSNQAVATYTDTLKINSNDPNNNLTQIIVTYTIIQSPKINLSTTNLNFIAEESGQLPLNQTFNITNTGGGNLNFTIASRSNWININPTSGTNNSTVTVNIATTNMVYGTYTDTIKINSSDPTNNLQTIIVTYAILQAPLVTTNAVTNLSINSSTLNGMVNANGNQTTVTFEYGLTTSYGSEINATPNTVTGNTNTNVSANITNLQPTTTYNYRLKVVTIAGTTYGLNQLFTTSANAPIVTTNVVTNLLKNSSTLNGVVNANGNQTTVTFEYGLTTTYGNEINATPNTVLGNTNTNVTANLTNLQQNTTYNCRVKAVSIGGTVYGWNQTFITNANLPTTQTNSASSITINSVTLNGMVNPNGVLSDAWFEYTKDTITGYITTQLKPIGQGATNTTITENITGLEPNTVYYYRSVAENIAGIVRGYFLSFNTNPLLPQLSILEKRIDFDTIGTRDKTINKNITITNSGWDILRVTSIYVENNDSIFTSSTNVPFDIQPGNNEPINIQFTPLNYGIKTNRLHIINNSQNEPDGIITINGVVAQPSLVFKTGIDFDYVKVVDPPKEITFEITNRDSIAIKIYSLRLEGKNGGQFEITGIKSNDTIELLKGEKKEIKIKFNADTNGLKSATLTMNNTDKYYPYHTIPITGNVYQKIRGSNLDVEQKKLQMDIYPNPFNPGTKIILNAKDFSGTGKGILEIYDILGRVVEKTEIEIKKGINEFTWQTKPNIRSGFYFMVIRYDNYRISKKVMHIK